MMFWSQKDSVYQTLRGKWVETLLVMQWQHSTTESEMLIPPLAPASLLTSWLTTFGWQVLKAKKICNLLFRTAGRIIFLQTYLFNILNFLLFIWSFSSVKKKNVDFIHCSKLIVTSHLQAQECPPSPHIFCSFTFLSLW